MPVFYFFLKAVKANQLQSVSILINASANINVKDTNGGRTPLIWGE
jgi:hypothetical protein